jgi:hypothetical protein
MTSSAGNFAVRIPNYVLPEVRQVMLKQSTSSFTVNRPHHLLAEDNSWSVDSFLVKNLKHLLAEGNKRE